MHLSLRFLCSLLLPSALLALPAQAALERTLDKSFTVAAGSVVKADLSGAPIRTTVGPAGSARIVLKQKFRSDSEAEADTVLEQYEVSCAQDGDTVRLVAKPKKSLSFRWGAGDRVSFAAEITVPADVRLDLDTSGGSIAIDGEMTAAVRANTSGGSIKVAGGDDLNLDTSGGSIQVRRALGRLRADTSGGSITVDYVGAAATDVNLDTSGGSIHVGVDPAAKLDVVGDTSGGRVRMDGFADFTVHKKDSDHVSGKLNGGGGRLRADTSGGGIRIAPAAQPGGH